MFGINTRPIGLVVATAVMVAPSATADVIMPGTRGIDHAVWVDPGELADQLWLDHVVEEEDTLSSIAEKYLGTAEAWRRIAEANSLEDEASLKPGQTLLIPPRRPDGGPEYHLFVLISYPFNVPVRRVQLNRPLPFFKWGCQLVAVDDEVLEGFEQTVESHGGFVLDETAESKEIWAGLHFCDEFSVRHTVSALSLVRSMKTTFELTSLGEGKLEMKVKERTKSRREDGATEAGEGLRRPLALASLGLGSLGCLVLLRRRGRFVMERTGR